MIQYISSNFPVLEYNLISFQLEYVRCRVIVNKISQVLLGYNTGFPDEELYNKWEIEICEKIQTFPDNVIIRDETEKYYNIIKVSLLNLAISLYYYAKIGVFI